MDPEPAWKKLRLSLERPYKGDNGEPLPELLDITPDGIHIYAPRDDPTVTVGEKLRRIFQERGVDFFERHQGGQIAPASDTDNAANSEHKDGQPEAARCMSPEELLKMRIELLPQLYIALGEMNQARDLLALLLSSASSQPAPSLLSQPLQSHPSQQSQPPSSLPTSPLAATTVSKPPPIVSVRAFDAQLAIGGKDKALRAAADLFKNAAQQVEDGQRQREKYWADALRIRRANWGLIPAPLPLGSATGKGAEKISRDFLVTYGLEESPPMFRRRAIGRISALDAEGALEFPLRQQTRLRVSLTTTMPNRTRSVCRSSVPNVEDGSVDGALRAAQAEVVEQEIFSLLIREASNLPTASAEVSERLINIDAAQGFELRLDLVDADTISSTNQGDPICNFIYAILHVLLSRAHVQSKKIRLDRPNNASAMPSISQMNSSPLLQPVIDILQYQAFCERVRDEIARMAKALKAAGVVTKVLWNPVADGGELLVKSLEDETVHPLSGEALLRIDDRQTLRFTMSSPSSLTAHLPQATLPIASITQLSQLFVDEVAAWLLNRISELGTELSERVSGTWFVDLLSGRTVGRWQGCILNFQVLPEGKSIMCNASRSGHSYPQVEPYQATSGLSLFQWVEQTVNASM